MTPPEDDDGFGSILMLTRPTSIKKKTPKNSEPAPSPRPDFLEPLSPTPVTPPPLPPTPWEMLGMTEEAYLAMRERVFKQFQEDQRKNYMDALIADLESPSYWNRRIEQLEREREFFNKKRGWSAADITCVERIDADIQECEDELERIYAEEDRLEVEYD